MREKGRSRPLIRSWQIVAILRSGGATLARLARETGCCTRTIRRDIAALEAAGVPLFNDQERTATGVWRFVKGSPCVVCGRGVATGKEYREP